MQNLFGYLVRLAAAQSGGTTGGIPFPNPLASDNITEIIDSIATQLIILGAPVAVIMALVGAFQMMTAGGDVEKFKNGQKTLLYTAVGYLVLLISKGVASIVKDLLA